MSETPEYTFTVAGKIELKASFALLTFTPWKPWPGGGVRLPFRRSRLSAGK